MTRLSELNGKRTLEPRAIDTLCKKMSNTVKPAHAHVDAATTISDEKKTLLMKITVLQMIAIIMLIFIININ